MESSVSGSEERTPCLSEIIIYDMVTGRVPGGHQEDYLLALEKALADCPVRTFAPFRTRIASLSNRTERLIGGYSAFRRGLDSRRKTLILVPNPCPMDFVLLLLAAAVRTRSGRGTAVFVMRRDAAGIVGAGWRAAVLDWIVRRLARGRSLFMISDARAAMDHWKARTGKDGPIVSIPVRLAATKSRDHNEPLTIGLIGLFRVEKGALHYSTVIEAAMKADPFAVVVCQLSNMGARPQEKQLTAALLDKWGRNGRVRFHIEHLDAEAFSAMLHGLDIVVLPYDVQSYGPGTSGILFEAVAAGKIVLTTPITWAKQEYTGHPNVIWLRDTDSDAIAKGLKAAQTRFQCMHESGEQPLVVADKFRSSWLTALDAVP
ncbi:MAG: glycosyltransferase [Rhizomicrobium sp.]